jgi:hypothetical protein
MDVDFVAEYAQKRHRWDLLRHSASREMDQRHTTSISQAAEIETAIPIKLD